MLRSTIGITDMPKKKRSLALTQSPREEWTQFASERGEPQFQLVSEVAVTRSLQLVELLQGGTRGRSVARPPLWRAQKACAWLNVIPENVQARQQNINRSAK